MKLGYRSLQGLSRGEQCPSSLSDQFYSCSRPKRTPPSVQRYFQADNREIQKQWYATFHVALGVHRVSRQRVDVQLMEFGEALVRLAWLAKNCATMACQPSSGDSRITGIDMEDVHADISISSRIIKLRRTSEVVGVIPTTYRTFYQCGCM